MIENKNIFFFIQARVGSSRLPQKVLLPFDGKNSILELLIYKLNKNFKDIPIVVCTSNNKLDDSIEKLSLDKGVSCFRGSENNVLKRFIDAATSKGADVIIRVCADNPFLDINFLKELIDYQIDNPEDDYWSFKNKDNIPVIKTHFGFFAEIVTINALKKVYNSTSDSLYLEHVTNYIYSNDEFNYKLKLLPVFLSSRNDLRFTIDDNIDFKQLQLVYQYYKNVNFDLKKTIEYIENNEEFLNTMKSNIKKYSK